MAPLRRARRGARCYLAEQRQRFTWHTYDANGTGGENSTAETLDDAMLFCIGCIVRQGWAPGGWEVRW